ncbi:hypothetical protein AJ80_01098 [Polytolypa hystricis UAMH7299]|uniref:Dipeptidase n=1 Tax=Polytolypa hystricis (strain UAMH7299) TaxID=1447883 RepID=A0A2B7Z237_POLH7|nr:hypothetical protein AJ80_01098 [Polytolypa hystricis UAMH7299]
MYESIHRRHSSKGSLYDDKGSHDETKLRYRGAPRRRSSAFVFAGILLSCLLIGSFLTVLPTRWRLYNVWDSSLSVDQLLQRAPLIDGHNDFPIFIRAFYKNDIYQKNFTDETPLPGQVDFPRLREGRVRGNFWSVYVGCPEDSGNFSDEVYQEAVHDTFQQIDLVHRLIKQFPQHLKLASSADDVWENFAKSDRISSMMGVEGLHQIGNSASILRMYHQLGVRYVTLTHFCHNKYADSASPEKPLHHGLSTAGEAMVREMNRLGMIVDLSHTSSETMMDTLRISSAPVIFSHSSVYALCPHSRNVPDDVLIQLKKNRGVIMIAFFPGYTRCDDASKASLSDVADHIQHAGELIGYEHVGFGSDFDGMEEAVKGLEDVSKYPDLVKELVRRGVSPKDIEGVIGANVLRVLKDVEQEAERLRDVHPLQDEVQGLFLW